MTIITIYYENKNNDDNVYLHKLHQKKIEK